MVATTVTTRLAELTGLDTESIQTQLIPFLSTFTTPDSLRVHLVDLLGSSPPARTFISDYVIQRFPRSKPPPPPPPPPPSEPAQVIPQASGSGSGSSRQKTKLTAKQRLLQPAKAKRIVKETPEALFGPVGTVYHKEANFVLDGYRGAASTSASASASASASGTTTPALVEHGTMSRQGSASNKTAHENQPAGTGTGADLPAPELETIAPTPAMKDIDALLAELVVPEDDSTPSELVICFCQGRVHPLHPHQPLCPTCALPICTSLHPSPLHPLSRCPSCARSPILPPHSPTRTTLISTLQSRRLVLELEERERIERVRRERRVRDDGIRERVNAFPALDGSSLPSSVVPQHMGTYGMAGYGPRSNAVAIALGRRAPTEVERVALQTRTHRVLRIPGGAPPSKKSGGKKSKKTKVAAAVGGGAKEIGSKSAAATTTAAPAAVIGVDEEEEGDSDEAEHEHALEVSITILIPDPTDDGWPTHQPPSLTTDDQQLAIQRQREMARTVGGQRLLANPRLRLEERPTYTGKREREVRRVAWEAVLLAEGEGEAVEEDEEGEGR
ncbi:hypothetical protein CF327_g3408 [Tilletia walkeri]|nr:hypothetical protein CF327_g3408 [Tilletia walkeri]